MKISYLVYDPIFDLAELDRRMGLAATFGYQGIELVATWPPPFAIEEVKGLSKKHHLPVVSLLSGWSYANEGLRLSSPDAAVRDRAVARLGDYVGLAARLGAVLVVGLMQGLRSDEPDEIIAHQRIADCLKRVAEFAEVAGVTVVIEPVNHQQVGFHNTAAEAAALAQEVNSPALGFMLDTMHLHCEERSVVQAILEHGPRARHFHLCDSNGGPFGTGGLDFAAVLETLRDVGYPHWVSVKIYRKTTWQDAARTAADFLRRHGVMSK